MLTILCTVLVLLRLTSSQQPELPRRPITNGGHQWKTTERLGLPDDQQPEMDEKPKQNGEQFSENPRQPINQFAGMVGQHNGQVEQPNSHSAGNSEKPVGQFAGVSGQHNGQSRQLGGQFDGMSGQHNGQFEQPNTQTAGNSEKLVGQFVGMSGQHNGQSRQPGGQFDGVSGQHNGQSRQPKVQFPEASGQHNGQFGQNGGQFVGMSGPHNGQSRQPGGQFAGVSGQHNGQSRQPGGQFAGVSGQHNGQSRQPGGQFAGMSGQPNRQFVGSQGQQLHPASTGRVRIPVNRQRVANKQQRPNSAQQSEFNGGPKPTSSPLRGTDKQSQLNDSPQRETDGQPRLTAIYDEEHPFCCRDSLHGAINDFGFELAKRLPAGDGGNLFFSPLSVSVGLSMMYLGAAGETARQMDKVLGYRNHDIQPSEVHKQFGKLLSGLKSGNNDFTLRVANGLFLQFEAEQNYLSQLAEYYKAALYKWDFAASATLSAKLLNEWVANETRNAIRKLFDGPISPMTRLVLVNAVYFRGTWKMQFPQKATYEGEFFRSDGTNKTVKFMHLQDGEFRFYEDVNHGYKFLELPYKSDRMAMLLALPRRTDAHADLNMTTGLLCRVNASMRAMEMEQIVLPRFKLEYAAPLKSLISAMGAVDLFKPRVADLSRIRSQKDLHVDMIMHKAVLEVNEEGSEAAAATGVVMVTLSLSNKPSFYANHPFLLYIVDKISGLVIFSGKVGNP